MTPEPEEKYIPKGIFAMPDRKHHTYVRLRTDRTKDMMKEANVIWLNRESIAELIIKFFPDILAEALAKHFAGVTQDGDDDGPALATATPPSP